jgi:hypothetical protein
MDPDIYNRNYGATKRPKVTWLSGNGNDRNGNGNNDLNDDGNFISSSASSNRQRKDTLRFIATSLHSMLIIGFLWARLIT